MPIFTTSIQHSITSPGQSSQARNKRHSHQKGRRKILTIRRGHGIMYKQNTPKLLKLINEFSELTGNKNIQKSVGFL